MPIAIDTQNRTPLSPTGVTANHRKKTVCLEQAGKPRVTRSPSELIYDRHAFMRGSIWHFPDVP